MKYFALRRIVDGKLMPDTGRGNRSRTEFNDYGPPRLFPARGGASIALRMWCQGIWTTDWDDDGRGLPYPSERSCDKTNRDPDDYDVVEVEVTVLGEYV